MFRAKFMHASEFKSIVYAIQEVVGTAHWRFTRRGIDLQELTSDHRVMTTVMLDYQSSAFQIYEYPDDAPQEFYLPLWNEGLMRILQASKPDDSLSLHSTVENPKTVLLTFEGAVTGALNSVQLQVPRPELDIRQIEGEILASVSMSSRKFAEICNSFAKSSQSVNFAISENGKTFTMGSTTLKGEEETVIIENGSVFQGESKNKMVKTSIETQREIAQTYRTKWLPLIVVPAKSLVPTVIISFFFASGQSEPVLLMEYRLSRYGNVKFYIMPMDD